MNERAAPARPRRYDPERRERMIEAALAVVLEHGLAALTFRAVAQRADVPLGSTSYHFADKVELLGEVVRLARERSRDAARAYLGEHIPRLGLVGGMCGLIERLTGPDRAILALDHELFLAAMREPAFREESRRWSADFVAVIAEHTDPLHAEVLGVFFDGLCLQAVVFDRTFTATEVEPYLLAITASATR